MFPLFTPSSNRCSLLRWPQPSCPEAWQSLRPSPRRTRPLVAARRRWQNHRRFRCPSRPSRRSSQGHRVAVVVYLVSLVEESNRWAAHRALYTRSNNNNNYTPWLPAAQLRPPLP